MKATNKIKEYERAGPRGTTRGERLRGRLQERNQKKKNRRRRHCLSGQKRCVNEEAHQTRHDARKVAEQSRTLAQGRAKDDEESRRRTKESEEGEEEEEGARREPLGRSMRTRETTQYIVHRGSDTQTHARTHTHPRQRARPQN